MCTGTVSFECLVKAKNGAKVAVIIGGKKTEFGAFRDNARDIRFRCQAGNTVASTGRFSRQKLNTDNIKSVLTSPSKPFINPFFTLNQSL
jgi:hypothetical protein